MPEFIEKKKRKRFRTRHPLNKMSNHRAGLVVYDRNKRNLVVLERDAPYNSNKRGDNDYFVEKFSIPRGEVKKSEDIKMGAIREFIEETRFFPKSINFIDESFNLYWHDPISSMWSYTIFFIECDLTYKNCINFDNFKENSNQKLIDQLDFLDLPIKMDLNKIKFSNMERYNIKIMDLESYISKMHKILPFYGENNYPEFFNFLKMRME